MTLFPILCLRPFRWESSAWQLLRSLSEQVFPLRNDDKQLPFRSVVLGDEMRLNRDDDGIHQLILPIFYLPQERWIFLRLATFVSAESVAKAGTQHWKSKKPSARRVIAVHGVSEMVAELCKVLSSWYKLGSWKKFRLTAKRTPRSI